VLCVKNVLSKYKQEMSSLSPFPLSGGKRGSRRHRRGGQDVVEKLPSGGQAGEALVKAGQDAKSIGGQSMEGGRRRKMTAKKVVKKLAVLAKQAKKLTMRLKKMKKHH
jgi:hypothetical protein